MVVQRLKDRLRRKFNVAVAEVDHQTSGNALCWEWPQSPVARSISDRCCMAPSRKVNTCWGATWWTPPSKSCSPKSVSHRRILQWLMTQPFNSYETVAPGRAVGG